MSLSTSTTTPQVIVSSDYPLARVREALAVSIATGTFTDTAYYLFSRRTADGGVGHPRVVYASSRVMRAAADHFEAQLNGHFSTDDNIPSETGSYAYELDSDLDESEAEEGFDSEVTDVTKGKGKASALEEDASAASTSTPDNPPDETPPRQAVKHTLFIPDVAVVTWNALVYFIYTGNVHFAPLRSNGLEGRQATVERHRTENPDLPALCSPKSMYRLADMVGLTKLKTISLQEITRQLSAKGIAAEVFSHFSSTYPDVLSAELRFLYNGKHMAQALKDVQRHAVEVVAGRIPHAEGVVSALLAMLSSLLAAHPGHPMPPLGAAWESPSEPPKAKSPNEIIDGFDKKATDGTDSDNDAAPQNPTITRNVFGVGGTLFGSSLQTPSLSSQSASQVKGKASRRGRY